MSSETNDMNVKKHDWRRRATVAGVALGLILAFTIGRGVGASSGAPSGDDEAQAAEGSQAHAGHDHADDTGGDVEYVCPMHPQIRQSEPGTCPICYMDLVPVEKGAGGGSDIPAVTLSENAARLARVQTEVLEPTNLTRTIDAFGRVEVAETGEVDLTAWVGGRIEKLQVNAVGEKVKRGQLLAKIYSPELLSSQKALLQATRNLDSARQMGSETRARAAQAAVDAARNELRLLGMTNAQINAVLKSGKARETVDVYATASGTVRRRNVAEGEYVQTGGRILSLAALDNVWVQLEIYERDLPFVREGMPVAVTVPALANETLDGRISFIDPVLDDKKRVARARLVVPNDGGRLRPGMYVRAVVEAPYEADAKDDKAPLSVPASAVLWTGPRSLVYRNDEGIGYVPVEVELGPRVGDRYVIREGLEKGDEIVVQGAFRIDASLQIKGGPTMMGGAAPAHDHGQHAEDLPKVEVAADGTEFDPPVQKSQLPDDVWYCDMGTVHYARGEEGDGRCPLCGMMLTHDGPAEGAGEEEAHDHAH